MLQSEYELKQAIVGLHAIQAANPEAFLSIARIIDMVQENVTDEALTAIVSKSRTGVRSSSKKSNHGRLEKGSKR